MPHRPQGGRNPRETPTEAATTRTRCGSKQVPSRNIAKATPCSTLKLLGRLWFSVDEDAQSEHPATLTGLPGRAHSCMVVVPAIGLLIELYCRVSAGALRFLFFALFFVPVENRFSNRSPRAYKGEKLERVCFPQAKLLYLLKLTGSRFILSLGIVLETGTGSWRLCFAFNSLPFSVFGKAPQHLLFALPTPDHTALLPHCVQDADDGFVLDLDVFS